MSKKDNVQRNSINELQWQNELGVDEVIANNPHSYIKGNNTSQLEESPQSLIQNDPSQNITINDNNQESPISSGEWNPRYQSSSLAFNCENLTQLQQRIIQFEDCALKKLAMNTVFSDGNSNANIMLIGEAPGEEEDKQGKPFVGKSGKLLDNILLRLGLNRQYNVYISNVLPWRPPGNRTPTPEEIKMCLPFLLRHIELIDPKIIVLVGGTAMSAILPGIKGVSQGRKRWHQLNLEAIKNTYRIRPTNIENAPLYDIMVTYHPSYLLRSPTQKIHAWYDMLMLQIKIIELGI